MRQPGWYWVKVDDTADWQPVEWTGGFWWTPSPRDWCSVDSDLYRVHEQRIEEPIEEE